MRELLGVMKAVSDESRLRILAALQGRELCLCQLVELLGLATSTVSRHASILQQARLVDSRKDGRWAYFRLDDNSPDYAREVSQLLLRTLEHNPQTRADEKRLRQILKLRPEDLCRKQSTCKC